MNATEILPLSIRIHKYRHTFAILNSLIKQHMIINLNNNKMKITKQNEKKNWSEIDCPIL